MGKVYLYDGKEFLSVKALASYTHVNEKTITARLRRGMTVEEACRKTDLRCSYHSDGEQERSVAEICKVYSKDSNLVRNRLHRGYSLDDALNKPKKISKQGCPIVVKGVTYSSIAAALRQLNLVHKEQTVRRRLKRGITPDEAFKD